MPVGGGFDIFPEIAASPKRISNLKTFPLAKVTIGMATAPPALLGACWEPWLPVCVAAALKISSWARAMISFTSCKTVPDQVTPVREGGDSCAALA